MKSLQGEILSNEKYGQDVVKMEVFSPYMARHTSPGQFVMVRCASATVLDPLLRRPISVFDIEKDFKVFSLLYLLRGRGTGLLSQMKKGDVLDFIGPLGKPIELGRDKRSKHILIGGGIGIAPLFLLARHLKEKGVQAVLVAGFKDTPYYGFEEDVVDLGIEHHIYCEKEEGKIIGVATDYLQDIKKTNGARIVCCGPKPMLARIQDMLQDRDVEAVGLLEEVMACGIGVCKGCAVKVRTPEGFAYQNLCTEGPAFDLKEVVF